MQSTIERGVLPKISKDITNEALQDLCEAFGLVYISIFAPDGLVSNYGYLEIETKSKSSCFNLPKKKQIDKAWIIAKINLINTEARTFQNLSKTVSKIVKNIDGGINVYAASYGIGVGNLYNKRRDFFLTKIYEYLDSAGIKYSLKYSNAMYVTKVIISKTRENLEKLEGIKI